jgi:hypothetical protein
MGTGHWCYTGSEALSIVGTMMTLPGQDRRASPGGDRDRPVILACGSMLASARGKLAWCAPRWLRSSEKAEV